MQHIVLIGFKHSGKSSIGRLLAKELERPYIDLDQLIEDIYQRETGEVLSCRDITKQKGIDKFRELEHRGLQEAINTPPPAVISLGGGAPLAAENQALLKGQVVVHVTGDPGRIYERIAMNGRPAFFPADKSLYEGFKELWESRKKTYERLALVTINNDESLEQAVLGIKNLLPRAQLQPQ